MVLFILGTKTIQVIFGLSLGTKCFLFFFFFYLSVGCVPTGNAGEGVSFAPNSTHQELA